jgi:hypothetical protein
LSGNFSWSKKKYYFGAQKDGKKSEKTKFGAQNQNERVIYPSIGNFHGAKKDIERYLCTQSVSDFDTHECDNDTHDCDLNTHNSDFDR